MTHKKTKPEHDINKAVPKVCETCANDTPLFQCDECNGEFCAECYPDHEHEGDPVETE